MIAKIYEDALKIIFEHACDGTPVVAKAEETVEDDDGLAGAVGFVVEFHLFAMFIANKYAISWGSVDRPSIMN